MCFVNIFVCTSYAIYKQKICFTTFGVNLDEVRVFYKSCCIIISYNYYDYIRCILIVVVVRYCNLFLIVSVFGKIERSQYILEILKHIQIVRLTSCWRPRKHCTQLRPIQAYVEKLIYHGWCWNSSVKECSTLGACK